VAGEPLLSDWQRTRLEANGRKQAAVVGTGYEEDFEPVVRLHDLEEGKVWLLTEISPSQPDQAYGLCLGDPAYPEPYMGMADLGELERLKEAGYLTADASFEPKGTVSDYLFRAQAHQIPEP
jgi:Protein of unknown function (DUF2958)